MYTAMLATTACHEQTSARYGFCMSAGATMPMEMLRRFRGQIRLRGARGYGLSETSGPACFNRLAALRKVGSIGTPIDGVTDAGGRRTRRRGADRGTRRDTSRAANVMKGYWNLPEATANAIVAAGFRLATAAGSTRTATSSLLPARAPDNPRRPLGPQDGPFTVGERSTRHCAPRKPVDASHTADLMGSKRK